MDSTNRAGESASAAPPGQASRRRKNHRGGKKKRQRRKSFAVTHEDMQQSQSQDPALVAARDSFYQAHGRGLSTASLESEALLDHREHNQFPRIRRPSITPTSSSGFQAQAQSSQNRSRLRTVQGGDSEDEQDDWNERAPLLSTSARQWGSETALGRYGSSDPRRSRPQSHRDSSRSSSKRKFLNPFASSGESYNVNYPPSVPGSPPMMPSERLDMSYGDALLRGELSGQASPRPYDEGHGAEPLLSPSPLDRRHTIAFDAEADVCFRHEGLSELAEDDFHLQPEAGQRTRSRRRRGKWPELGILDEWSRLEKEGRTDERRSKKITEPQLINGRLRPVNKGWYRTEEDAPYRFTYFNEELQSTIHSQTISELVQPGGSFRELFIPDPPVLSDSEDDEDDELEAGLHGGSVNMGYNGESRIPSRAPSLVANNHPPTETHGDGTHTPTPDKDAPKESRDQSGTATPLAGLKSPSMARSSSPGKTEKPLRYGERPVWWLDVLSPSETEMRVISKAFGIHPLTAEDIMMQEAREKVELFSNYYFVNYRTFDQDQKSSTYMDPVDMYVVVFREGVLSFHFSMTPHPANVRRRIRQLHDYMILSSDWISYAIVDDITDAFVPLIENVEEEVDDIDDVILKLHSNSDPAVQNEKKDDTWDRSVAAETTVDSGADMLRRVGHCRKQVMGLFRLLSNKADVIKGFAKRCNEHWDVAPRSEIGLYLGDIQDHIVTMTANLSHYEKILARAHGNYLAQINIRMNERAEKTADVLGKLTVLGTIVLPMNIITGLWGMNVWVPGQEYEGDLTWFYAITGGLLLFGLACYWTAKRVYGIV